MKRRIIVCLLGVDGSGKTTVAKLLRESLHDEGIASDYIWCGWRGFESWLFKPVTVPTKNALIRRGNEAQVASAHKKIPLFDYLVWLDYFVRVYPSLAISLIKSEVIVVDRYVFDVTSRLSTSGGESNSFVLKLFQLFPQPSVVLFIDVPPALAYERKDDVPSLEYLRERDAETRQLLKHLQGRVITLDGTRSASELAEEALAVVRGLRT
jgi:thymidylate kinase